MSTIFIGMLKISNLGFPFAWLVLLFSSLVLTSWLLDVDEYETSRSLKNFDILHLKEASSKNQTQIFTKRTNYFPSNELKFSAPLFFKKKTLISSKNENKGGEKFLITDQNDPVLKALSNAARLAKLAYCLNEDEDEVAPGILVKVEKNLYEGKSELNFELVRHPIFHTAMIDKIFLSSFNLASEKIVKKIEDAWNNNSLYRINLIGHSVGGVYAVLTAITWALKKTEMGINVFTFGQPRIGDFTFAQIINQQLMQNTRIFRVTHTNDYVPRLPLNKKNDMFHHALEIWISSDCDCDGKEMVYRCYGPTELFPMGLGLESQASTTSHFGPYFGYTMRPKCKL
ncbi:hypothetical protein G9A89_008957 [Geosiphon pyriformis]|nr:hypothetical protein G9A89_008957 [Geosiphon pyriformis]